jgi:cell division protein FtsL
MTRLNLVLLAAVVASALYLVHIQFESRQLFVQIDRAEAEARKLAIENDRLQVEKRAQATPLRVEKLGSRSVAHADHDASHHPVCGLAGAPGERGRAMSKSVLYTSQPLAGQQDAGLAQQIHCGGHCPGVRGAGRSRRLHPGVRQRFFPAPG